MSEQLFVPNSSTRVPRLVQTRAGLTSPFPGSRYVKQGVASNKMLSKLGSGHKKPNGQTVIRHRAVRQFLSSFKFTKIRNLGGKLGDQIAQTFNTESVSDLLLVPVEQFKSKLGDDTGVWVHNTIRGIDNSEVNSRVQIKSMLSAKSFRPSINSVESAVKWLRIFVSDIFSRLVEEGVLENKRRPRSIHLHHRHGGQTRSRQGPIPQGRPIDKELLLDLAKNLLNQIVLEGKVWPCKHSRGWHYAHWQNPVLLYPIPHLVVCTHALDETELTF